MATKWVFLLANTFFGGGPSSMEKKYDMVANMTNTFVLGSSTEVKFLGQIYLGKLGLHGTPTQDNFKIVFFFQFVHPYQPFGSTNLVLGRTSSPTSAPLLIPM